MQEVPDGLDFHSCCQFFRSVVIFSCEFSSTRNLIRNKLELLQQIAKSSKLAQASSNTKAIFLQGLNRIMLEVRLCF
jgi:hypothetical protein